MPQKKKICIFVHYHFEELIPYNVQCYVKELCHYFDEIIVITNERKLHNKHEIEHPKITLLQTENSGYDLGMFYRAYKTLTVNDYQQIACVNDSILVFNRLTALFEWAKTTNFDFWGMTDTDIRPSYSTHEDNYHIQSFFLVFNQKAIEGLEDFFTKMNINDFLNEKNIQKLKHKVINDWEIGVSQFLIKKGLRCGAYIRYEAFKKETKKPTDFAFQDFIMNNGLPVVKKKTINAVKIGYWLWFGRVWKRNVRKSGNSAWDLERIINEVISIKYKRIFLKYKLL
jgi:lipopolysaccharide biosynthesis protein